MPANPDFTFDIPGFYPYMSVCTTGTHDTSTLRYVLPHTNSFYIAAQAVTCAASAPMHINQPWQIIQVIWSYALSRGRGLFVFVQQRLVGRESRDNTEVLE